MIKIRFIIVFILFIFSYNFSIAKQELPQEILDATQTIEARKTGEKGETYFYCLNDKKCSTEDIVKEYYQNKGYKVMRAEYTFWNTAFAIAFFDEIFSIYKFYYSDIPSDMFSKDFYNNRKDIIEKKYELLQSTDLINFMNKEIKEHGDYNTRLLNDRTISGYEPQINDLKTPIAREFFKKIDNDTFAKVVYRIAKYPGGNMRGIPDFVVWNNNEIIFVEVKRQKEKLREGQIIWGKFLIENKIPYKVLRVQGI